jgi:hypothetical protein
LKHEKTLLQHLCQLKNLARIKKLSLKQLIQKITNLVVGNLSSGRQILGKKQPSRVTILMMANVGREVTMKRLVYYGDIFALSV